MNNGIVDTEQNDLIKELSAGLRAQAAMTPRSADPFGPVRTAIAADRRRRTVLGASVAAVVAVAGGAAVAGGLGLGNGRAAHNQRATVLPGDGTSSSSKTGTPTVATTTPPTGSSSTPPSSATTTSTAFADRPGWPLLYPTSSTFGASQPTVNAMIHAYGKPVDDGSRTVLLNMIDSFHVCGYDLGSYTFKLQWAGDLAHSGGHGAAAIDITRGGATYRMVGYDTYKGVLLALPIPVTGAEASHPEVTDYEFDQPNQTDYQLVTAEPGSKVVVSVASAPLPAVTAGPSGVVEVQTAVLQHGEQYSPPQVTGITITRPDGSTVSAPQPAFTRDAEQTARHLLPSDTQCTSANWTH